MRKLTIEEVKRLAREIGKWEVLDGMYINANTKLNCKCVVCGCLHKVAWSKIQQRTGCPYCVGNMRKTIEFIRLDFKKYGYILTTTKYENNKQKLDFICPKGHVHSITWTDWQQGNRCFYCANQDMPSTDFIRFDFEKNEYILLTEVIENSTQRLDYICPNGHTHYTTWNKWQQGRRCPYCYGNIKYNINQVKEQFEKEKYVLLTGAYKNNKSELVCVCPEGHKFTTTFDRWLRGHRCPICFRSGRSRFEEEVKCFVDMLCIDYMSNNKTQLLNPNTNHFLELDIWFPQLNKAIECNGIYWHSSEERRCIDNIKQQLCKQQGIDLLVITDEEWNKDINKCKKKIKIFVYKKEVIKYEKAYTTEES